MSEARSPQARAPRRDPPHTAVPPPQRHWRAWAAGGCLGALAVALVGCALVAGALGGLAWHYANQRETPATGARTLVVAGRPQIVVANGSGDVTVAAGATGRVVVRSTTDTNASGTVPATHLTTAVSVAQDGDYITITTPPGGTSADGAAALDLTVSVPMDADLTLSTVAGDVTVDGVAGIVTASAERGEVVLRAVTLGGASSVRVGSGTIALDGALADGAAVDLRAEHGNVRVTLARGTAAHVDAATAAGRVTLYGWQVVDTQAQGAVVSALHADTAADPTCSLSIQVGSGSITIALA